MRIFTLRHLIAAALVALIAVFVALAVAMLVVEYG